MNTDSRLYLVSGNKNDDYDVREGAPDGPVVGRIYKLSVAPTGHWWFWAVQLFPAVAADSGTAETCEAAKNAVDTAATGLGLRRRLSVTAESRGLSSTP